MNRLDDVKGLHSLEIKSYGVLHYLAEKNNNHHHTNEGPPSSKMISVTADVASLLTTLHNLKLHCSSVGKGTPHHDGASTAMTRGEHFRRHLYVMTVTVEAIRIIQIDFSSRQNFSISHDWNSRANIKRFTLWRGSDRGPCRPFLSSCLFLFSVAWLLNCS